MSWQWQEGEPFGASERGRVCWCRRDARVSRRFHRQAPEKGLAGPIRRLSLHWVFHCIALGPQMSLTAFEPCSLVPPPTPPRPGSEPRGMVATPPE